jgi:hypothetical protein
VQPFPWRIFSFVQKKFLFRTPQSRNSITWLTLMYMLSFSSIWNV